MPFPFNFKFPHTAYHARQENSEYPYSDYHIIDLDFIIDQIKQLWTYVQEHVVEFPLTLVKGGTGATTAAEARTNLGLGAVATDNRVPISRGGTNATTAAAARSNLGLGAAATLDTIPIANGGTGATTAAQARQNLGIEETTVSFPITLEKGGTGVEADTIAELYNTIGVLGLQPPTELTPGNLNNVTTAGVYHYKGSPTNKPSGTTSDGFLIVLYLTSTSFVQIAISNSPASLFTDTRSTISIRRASGSVFTDWVNIYGSASIIPLSNGGTGATTAADAITNLGIINSVYPVGSIYMSVNSTSPATLFGGTWEQLKDKFLLGAGDTYTAGNTGGEATHTLTTNEIPSHNHTVTSIANVAGTINVGYGGGTVREDTQSTSGTGGGQAHNNMPPYLVVYMWKRTA